MSAGTGRYREVQGGAPVAGSWSRNRFFSVAVEMHISKIPLLRSYGRSTCSRLKTGGVGERGELPPLDSGRNHARAVCNSAPQIERPGSWPKMSHRHGSAITEYILSGTAAHEPRLNERHDAICSNVWVRPHLDAI
jgi:hypothetical protein